MAVEYLTEAILLAVRDWGTADRVVTLFSLEYGKITTMAYGARKPKSKLGGSLQAFSHLSLLLSPGKGMDAIRQCETRTSFREIREDLIRLAYGNFIVELTGELWPERQPEPHAFALLWDILSLLSIRNPRISALAGAWQLLALAGFRPEYGHCVRCGKELEFPACFCILDGGGVCFECRQPGNLEFDQAAQNFLNRLILMDLKCPGQFSVNAKMLINAEAVLNGFLTHQLEKSLKSLAFIKQVSML